MYDATGVRRETGKQAVVINEIVQKMFVNGESITDEELKELVGHTHVEVIGGVIVGLLTAGSVPAVYVNLRRIYANGSFSGGICKQSTTARRKRCCTTRRGS